MPNAKIISFPSSRHFSPKKHQSSEVYSGRASAPSGGTDPLLLLLEEEIERAAVRRLSSMEARFREREDRLSSLLSTAENQGSLLGVANGPLDSTTSPREVLPPGDLELTTAFRGLPPARRAALIGMARAASGDISARTKALDVLYSVLAPAERFHLDASNGKLNALVAAFAEKGE
ncbi:hypothetical protein [Desulfuromonas sp. DDH964]|uniref:hypothetical protein n=1 Tax=Desulfuromonas sp. DDH964 TaxID=1823759 RepID=UPI00082C3EB4|nr:hypothetical protein [Desulfuromonas sp. DDH964]